MMPTIIISYGTELVHIFQNYARTFLKQHFTAHSSMRTNGYPNLLVLTFWIVIVGMQCRSVLAIM